MSNPTDKKSGITAVQVIAMLVGAIAVKVLFMALQGRL
jgi:hypothetical protein